MAAAAPAPLAARAAPLRSGRRRPATGRPFSRRARCRSLGGGFAPGALGAAAGAAAAAAAGRRPKPFPHRLPSRGISPDIVRVEVARLVLQQKKKVNDRQPARGSSTALNTGGTDTGGLILGASNPNPTPFPPPFPPSPEG